MTTEILHQKSRRSGKGSRAGVPTSRRVRHLKPFSCVSPKAWLWDNMYGVWRKRYPWLTVKEAILCCYTHYTNSLRKPQLEPNVKDEPRGKNADTHGNA